jgi:putative FmdB family regulatory protein
MIYEYKCTKCQKVYDVFSNYVEKKDKKCIFCGEKSYRIMSKANVIYKNKKSEDN